ncbi:MAG: WYL domain-containing protein [Firmicutes bacterium]|nr:WYL domain-containing protein [Bacillota bacterium]
MIFSELYSSYYNAVASIIKAALDHQISREEIRSIIEEHAFGESMLTIYPSLTEGKWQLLNHDLTTSLEKEPVMPFTLIEKQWIKAIALDPRIRLFGVELPDFPETEPLFRPEDICVFDKYLDGDPFDDEKYIANFRFIMEAVRNKWPLDIKTRNRHGNPAGMIMLPSSIEYSEKDDKFRVIGTGDREGDTVNLGRVISIRRYEGDRDLTRARRSSNSQTRKVTFELIDERNALERVLLHFAHFRKEAERIGDNKYIITLWYDKSDETEMVIRILSFGPMVKVTEPYYFKNLIKERLIKQKSCGL